MKRLLVTVVLLGASHLLRSQGLLSFEGGDIFTNGLTGPIARTPNSYYFALLVAPTSQTTISSITGPIFGGSSITDPTLNGWAFAGDIGTNTTVGHMSGNGAPGAPDGSSVAVNGYAPLSVANFAVVGWSAKIGTTWAQADQVFADPGAFLNDYFGVSTVATNITLAPAGGPYPEIFGTPPYGQIPGMTLYPIVLPEPGTLALCALGSAVVAVSRRRRN